MALDSIPKAEELIEILEADGAPPWIMLDVGGSDFDGDGVIYVALGDEGDLVEVQP